MDINKCNGILTQLTSIVREASLLMTREFEISSKGGCANIVTTNDLAVQDYLIPKLTALIPGCGFMCEENDFSAIKDDTWIIDPIDGTTNYSRGVDFCAISVALLQGNEIILGAVFLPYKNEMFTAVRGQGAYLNVGRIRVSNRSFADSLFCTSLCAYHKENLEACSKIINDTFLQCNDIRRFGSAASELCYIAAGRCELFFEYELYPWDYAAASLILEEAGGYIFNLKGIAPHFDTKTGIIAANDTANFSKLLKIVNNGV